MIIINYFTKWVEVKSITVKKMVQFYYRNIMCLYGIPHKIILDNGLHFDYAKFQKFCDDLGIKKVFFAVTHPRINSQVEVVNKTLK